MELNSLWNKNSVCLNLSNEDFPYLRKQYNCIHLKYNLDYRNNNFRRKLFTKLSRVVQPNQTVFVVMPEYDYHIPIILSILSGISANLPNIIYFNRGADPNLENPLVEDLESLRWLSNRAVQTNQDYFNYFAHR